MNKVASSVLTFVNCDAGEVAEFFARRYSPCHVEPDHLDGTIHMKGVFGRLPGIDFNTTEFKAGFEIAIENKAPSYFFMFPASGDVQIRAGRYPLETNANFATASFGESIQSIRFCSGLRNSTLSVDRVLIIERLSLLLDRPITAAVTFESVVDRGSGKIHSIAAINAFLSESAFGSMIDQTPIAAKQMSNAIVDLVLEAWPHNFSDSLSQPYATVAPRHVRRAIEYMRECPHQEHTVDQLANICGVSLRGLQYGFRKFVGMTISQYERQLRLDGARRSLMADPTLSVKEVARLWHFTNVHRFSSEFQSAFGVTPLQLKSKL
ncbi:AraC family transcriptional regulator [Rhizobium sp. VS19-DR104.2]|uniref:helix-turn-helix transcriptional regulator n=1 Tax=unclassified Rhizobium TaxID=2613769 RepID=UPI001CC8166D|nr:MULTISPECIES: AraC family transcriptional regulator [unclassified Rhizobium]MBZ5763533.1 AraC family transcriptional regulator [Rhizobium sp. VS19-DR96]MBZ5769455.1 AraC family transcriptional regulator [Rhizobium sp. VS19-DR129.2]MBZ5777004.1 AraC family transcriptional regulator [Rhizobium sp. VS19-DRK62.2]MBZ5788130.1 AraC family transcriptional regulator [Rhizobium sp. VS19-DR121]MBZ5805581.1 AraC family transcriptional regulator [Rhizobium sp. VS19-DR181]